jgi:hypothetical protein
MIQTRLIVLDGVCWPGFAAACRQGRVPTLARLAAAGATGLLYGVPHQGRIGAAASIASGHWPEASGLWFPEEAWAGGVRPATIASWQRPPLWASLAAAGIGTASVAWPGSAPGGSAAGLHVDDRYPRALGQTVQGWALPPDCCPPAWRDELADRRIHPTAITTGHLLPLVPDLGAVDQAATDALGRLAITMAEAATAQGAAAWIFAHRRPDTAALWLSWLGDIRAGTAAAARSPWDHLVAGAWTFLDTLVGALAALAGNDRLLIVGTGWAAAPGLVLAHGPEIAPGTGLPAAQQIDIAPTILAWHGLADPGLAGRPLPLGVDRACRDVPPPPPQPAEPSAAAAAYLAPLLAEGFAPPPPPSPRWQAARALALGRLLLDRDAAAAEATAEAALAAVPDNPDALTLKAWCRYAADDAAGVDAIGVRLETLAPDHPWGAMARGAAAAMRGDAGAARPFLDAAAKGDAETRLRVARAWLRLRQPAAAMALLGPLAVELPGRAEVRLAQAEAAAAVGNHYETEMALRAALVIDPYVEQAWAELETLLVRLGRRSEATRAAAMLAQLQVR